MREFKTPEDLREYLLSIPHEFEDDFYGTSGSCYSLSWKKDHWIIRVNNKKIGVITSEDVPSSLNLRDKEFVLNISSILRNCNGSLQTLKEYLEGLNK